jgi:MFS family permease
LIDVFTAVMRLSGSGKSTPQHYAATTGSVAALAVALALLGLGWNLGLVSGTAMITDALPLNTRARTQGTVDLCVALAGAGGGIASGMILAATNLLSAPIAETVFEAKVGGHIYDRGVDGDEGWPLYLNRYAALFTTQD